MVFFDVTRLLRKRCPGNSLLFSILNPEIHYHSMSTWFATWFVPRRPQRRRKEAQRERALTAEDRKAMGFKGWSSALAWRMKPLLRHEPPRRAKHSPAIAGDHRGTLMLWRLIHLIRMPFFCFFFLGKQKKKAMRGSAKKTPTRSAELNNARSAEPNSKPKRKEEEWKGYLKKPTKSKTGRFPEKAKNT